MYRILRRPAIVAAVIFACVAFRASGALAHDPGLSSTTIVAAGGDLSVTMRFHDVDLAGIVDPGSAGVLPGEPLRIRSGDRTLIASRIEQIDGEADQADFLLTFTGTRAADTVDVPLLALMPPGHKHYVEIRDGAGTVVASSILSAAAPSLRFAATGSGFAGGARSAFGWMRVGIEHILEGFDHLLFVFALLLGAASVRASVRLITAFTIGHSIALALAVLGIVDLPSSVVEPAIAASIVIVAVLAMAGASHERAAVVLGFGLIHGLGFAGVLVDAGVASASTRELLTALFSFNLGVEIGQLGVTMVVLPALLALRRSDAFRRGGVRWGSAAVAACGTFWFVERVVLA